MIGGTDFRKGTRRLPRVARARSERGSRSRTKEPAMSIPLVLTCLCLGWAEPPGDPAPAAAPAAAFDVVASIETVVADAIARAEPSVVAIARRKAENNPKGQT